MATGAAILVSTMHPYTVLALGCLVGLCVGFVAGVVFGEKADKGLCL